MKIIEQYRKGIFIVFEGIDGCGKSTILPLVTEQLKLVGFPVLITREPGGTNCPAAEEMRNILLKSSVSLCAEAEMYLFAASRAQHIRNFIIPHLQAGEIVISDRFLWSSLAYQGVGINLGKELVAMINAPAVQGLSPNITFLLDISPKKAWERIKDKRHDRFEKEGIKFLRKIRKAYLQLAKANPNNTVIINAALPPDKVAQAIFKEIVIRIPSPEYFKRG